MKNEPKKRLHRNPTPPSAQCLPEDSTHPDPFTEGLSCHLVGGAVRDALLGRPSAERDWVVLGATPEAMLERGFKQVGRAFPVFLHPETKEEYALARTENKTAPGHTGFEVRFSPDVTLEEDLQRRDLTINAMALDPRGNTLLDPWGGRRDLEKRLLRHVSPSFRDDPLRVLRVARFRATLNGFTVAGETSVLLTEMVGHGELACLSPERLFDETRKALGGENPAAFFTALEEWGALQALFPELAALKRRSPCRCHHRAATLWQHALQALDAACGLSRDPRLRLAALLHELEPEEARGLCRRLRAPNAYQEAAFLGCRFHKPVRRALALSPTGILRLLDAMDVWRQPERLNGVVQVCRADLLARRAEAASLPQLTFLEACLEQGRRLTGASLKLPPGPELGLALHQARRRLIARLRRGY
ncbi:MAG: multifunctional CCA tRNA nucleotidyl transferase/2'3'-cyclic phosphodiesterase/2'nucleotidase/phosphatase [Magnetococcales bacterium]|nr:multifunctional CCA tRNA nucleotidyl transferase/2'3'-cyclic phosphodiesterase/2'nucleotidase/phosphatase [Magnetococcales bacterium]